MSQPSDDCQNSHPVGWDPDGTPVSKLFDDTFYSRAGGRQECRHVFLAGNGLPGRWPGADQFTIAELGFGTGLNVLETWLLWQAARKPDQHLHFVSFEAFPLGRDDIARAHAASPELSPLSDMLTGHWKSLIRSSRPTNLDGQTDMTLITGSALAGVSSWNGQADAWYLDGFSPDKNPEMWSEELMQQVFLHTAPGGTFATYTSAGWVRRNLIASGFEAERAEGFGRKRHMTRGRKPV